MHHLKASVVPNETKKLTHYRPSNEVMSANTNPLRDRRKTAHNANTRAKFQAQQTAKDGGTSFADITKASRRSFMEM